jgi:hypothetical protein
VLHRFNDLKAQPGRSGRVPYAAYSSAMRALQMQRNQVWQRGDLWNVLGI